VVRQARTDAEDGGQPIAVVLLGAERRAEGALPAAGGGEQPRQPGQGQVGIGAGGDRGDQRSDLSSAAVRAEIAQEQELGPRGIRESHSRQPPASVVREPRTRVS